MGDYESLSHTTWTGGFRREVQPRRQHWFLNEKVGFPRPHPRLLLGFQGTKSARREGMSSPFNDAGGCTSPQNSGRPFNAKQGRRNEKVIFR